MDTVKARKIVNAHRASDKVYSDNLLSVLDKYPHINTLSLDCFDTILWRKTSTPHDLFYDLQHRPAFKALNFSAALRMNAEGQIRQLGAFNEKPEVTLKDIYLESFPNLNDAEIKNLEEDELAEEMEVCYVFPPIIELIKAAAQRGIKVIIVSDTYFREDQLKRLLAHAMPNEVLSLIDRIYCSCDYVYTKSTGLFKKVLEAQNISPESVLHIGDNLIADYTSPLALKINALHFIQFNDAIKNIQSLYAIASNIINPAIRTQYSLPQPFRGLLSISQINNAESLIGYATLGPIMFAFANFIYDEVNQLRLAGKKPKVAFLMRDGHLPALASEALVGHEIGKRIHISRFASYAASFRTKADVDRYLLEVGKTNRYYDLAKQLLIPENMIIPLVKVVDQAPDPRAEFIRLIHREDILKIIFTKSAEYRERLMRHLYNEIGLQAGDTLVLVDLGYYGTTQRRLAPVFKDMGIEVLGRYLISLRVPDWQSNRKGLIDASWCDDQAMQTLVFYIILLEQLCTANENSVVNFDQYGNAIHSESGMDQKQHEKLIAIQSECIRFIKDAKMFFESVNTSISLQMLKRTAMGKLMRLLFFPAEVELAYLQDFQAEMNLGTQDLMRVFDAEQGLLGLRRRGMLYMEKPSKNTRSNYPAELRVAGIEWVLSLISQHRFNLDISLKDMMLRKEPLQLNFIHGQEQHVTSIEAVSTHDGYYSAWIPTKIKVEIVFGKNYHWLQIDSVELIEMNAFIKQGETQNTLNAWGCIVPQNMMEKCKTNVNGKLFECLSETSALVFVPDPKLNAIESVCRIVFRPIMLRQ